MFKAQSRRGVLAATAVVFLILPIGACSSETIVTQGSPTDPSKQEGEEGDDSGTAAAEDARAARDAAPTDAASVVDARDAALPPEKVTVTSSTAGTTCAAVCSGSAYTCATTCTFGNIKVPAAGQATYSRTVNTVTSYSFVGLSTCATPIAATYTDPNTAAQYTLGAQSGNPISCCCLGPGHVRAPGDPKAPKSCTDVCAALGRTCDPNTTWTFGDKGGMEAEYRCSPTSTSFTQDTCAAIPPATRKTCPLESYKCGCL